MDENFAWENLKRVRHYFLNKYDGTPCTYLLTNEDINKNILLFMNLLNASRDYPYHLQKNLTKKIINNGARMFLYLNSCPYTSRKEYFALFLNQVFKTYIFEPTNTGMILYTLNLIKVSNNDERIIASKILKKLSSIFKLSLVQSQNGHKILTEKTALGNLGWVYTIQFPVRELTFRHLFIKPSSSYFG